MHNPLDNPELSTTLPKEEPQGHQSSFSTPVEVENNSKGKGIVIYFIVVALISFLIGLGSMAAVTFGLGKMKNSKMTQLSFFHANASPTPAKTGKNANPTIVPTKPVDLSAYNIKILNGSEITGGASKLKMQLTTAGFTVISTGNAETSNYTDTIVSTKKD